VSTKPKKTGEVILVSDHGEPLLARWRVGVGTAVAWTSDVKNRWSTEWIKWGNYPKFWAQVVRSSMRRKIFDSYDMHASIVGGRAMVVVDAVDESDKFVNELDTTLEIVDPKTSKPQRSLAMDQTAAGRYSATFDVDRYGSYMLKAVHRRDGKTVAESMGSVALPYPLEYLFTRPNADALEYASTVTGGLHNADSGAVIKAGGEPIKYREDLWPWVLLFVACSLIVDTFLKRVRVFGYRTVKFE
jgi:hypothetical protein